MGTITLPNFRTTADVRMNTRLKDGGVSIDWAGLTDIKAWLYSDAQKAIAGRCDVSISEADSTLLVCEYTASKPQYPGVNRLIVQARYDGRTKTYDKPVFNFVTRTAEQAGAQITMDDPEVDVEIEVEDVSSSILDNVIRAAIAAAERAEAAAEEAEHMVDIHTGPEGKSAYEVAVEEGYTGTEEEWLASLKGPVGETPDISIGTVTTVEPGQPAAATMGGTPEAPVLNLAIPQGLVGATPNFTIGTVTTGEPGTPVVVTITGTPEAPVLNVTIPQGAQGNTGSSVAYPFELVNNLTTNDATKALSAAQGVVLDGKVTQLEAKVDDIYSDKTVPDVYTFDGVDDAISFDAITLAVDGDAFEFDVMANGTGATKGMAFGTNNGNRTIEVAESCLALGYGNGSWVTGMNGGSGLLNLATLNKKLTQRRKILLLRDSGNIKVYIDGELIHSEALSNTVTLSKIGGPYSTNYWLGVLYSFRYIHGGVTKEIYELPGYSVSGNIAYTTKRVVSGVLEETIEAVDALDERVEGTENGLTDLEGETFAEQEVTTTIDVSDIPGVVKMAGYNAGPNSSTEIAFNALSGYDSYYFYPSSALSAWLTDPGVTYIALSVIENAQPFNNNSIYGTGAARYRKSDSDLPSANSPLSIPSGSAVIVTVTAGAMVGFATKSNITTFNGNTPLAEEHIEQVLDAIEENGEGEPMYVAKNAGKLYVYLRIPNGKYIRYPFVKRYKAYTENEYPSFYDNWGIGVPALAEFSGTMADVAPLFLSGEAELAVSVPSGKDGETATYVGGQAHGFENIVTGSNGREICILVDNQKVAEDAVLSLIPASKVDIIQHTQICQAYTNTNPFADVTKHWVWENGKMSCTTSVKVLRSILFSFAQFGMMCVYRRWLGDASNDYLTNSAIKNDNPYKVWDVSDGWSGVLQSPDKDCTRIVEYGQKGLGFSMSIKSETIKSNGGMFVATNGLAYNKIYFDMGRSFTPSVNDVLEGTQTWEILG